MAFDRIYRQDARMCAMLVSTQYADSMWTNLELRSARARALMAKNDEYILPIRIDDTELPGLPPTIGYLSVEQYSIDKIADLLIAKLGHPDGAAS